MARFGGQPFTPHEDALVDRMVADGWAFDRIADALGRPSRASVRHRYVKRQAARDLADMARALAARAKHRNCGMCGGRFLSQHAGVRRCDPCRGLSVSPFEPDGPGDLAGVRESVRFRGDAR